MKKHTFDEWFTEYSIRTFVYTPIPVDKGSHTYKTMKTAWDAGTINATIHESNIDHLVHAQFKKQTTVEKGPINE